MRNFWELLWVTPVFLGLGWPSSAQDSQDITHDVEVFCLAYTNHIARDDVAFQPGVGLSGESVPPADLHAPLQIEADDLIVPITLDLAERLDIDLAPGVEGEALVGVISVRGGEAFFNDQLLNPGQNQALLQYCKQME